MAAPYSIDATVPAASDNISIFPASQEQPFRTTVKDWLEQLSDSTTGLLKGTALGTTTFTWEKVDNGAAGPIFELYLNSASPTVSDILGSIQFSGEDTAGNKDIYASISSTVYDATSASEDGSLAFSIKTAGTLASAALLTNVGLTMGTGYAMYAPRANGFRFADETGTGVLSNSVGQLQLFVSSHLTAAATASSFSIFGTFAVSGNIATGGSVTATGGYFTSDERLKVDWEDLSDNLVDQLAAMRSGSYYKLDQGCRAVGISAQEMQDILPEAITTTQQGFLAVDYAGVAMVGVVELAKRLTALEAKFA